MAVLGHKATKDAADDPTNTNKDELKRYQILRSIIYISPRLDNGNGIANHIIECLA
jgi:hypothetical protein